jgi:hypothetical protein
VRVSDFGWFGELLQSAVDFGHLVAMALQLGIQADERLIHLFEIVLQVRDGHFESNQSLFIGGGRHGIALDQCSWSKYRLRLRRASYRIELIASRLSNGSAGRCRTAAE